jgi:hypothetical protein
MESSFLETTAGVSDRTAEAARAAEAASAADAERAAEALQAAEAAEAVGAAQAADAVRAVAAERDFWFLLRYLTQTCDGVAQAVAGLSETQWTFSAAPGRWSIALVVEHLAAAEEFILQRIVPRLRQSAAEPLQTQLAALHSDAQVLELERDPATGVVVAGRVPLNKAPGPIEPLGRWSHDESLRRLLAARVRTIEHLQWPPELRRQVVEHLAFGALDGYQWVLFVAAHTERHTRQILDIKADPRFPAK